MSLPISDRDHSSKVNSSDEPKDFVFDGPNSPPLRTINLGQLLDEQRTLYPKKVAVSSRFQCIKLSYQSLWSSSRNIARRLLAYGVRPGDHVLVLAGNCVEYSQLFFAVGGMGAIFATVNPTFTLEEVIAAVKFLGPKLVFVAAKIGYHKNEGLVAKLIEQGNIGSALIELRSTTRHDGSAGVLSWEQFLEEPLTQSASDDLDAHYWSKSDAQDTLCVQFTSGTTGPRKAGMLTHSNLINNALFIGDRLCFTSEDVLCCCPPLFHCFGLVCGLLAAVAHGMAVVLSSDIFNTELTLPAIAEEGCTIIHAVPAMFQALLDHPAAKKHAQDFRLRTGIIAGSMLSETLLQRLNNGFGLRGLAYAFGMTELSAVSFMTNPSNVSLLDDCSSVGTLMAHTSAKVVDENLHFVPPGMRGELLVSGYLVFKGYYRNAEKTRESILTDENGRQWLRTGDVVTLDASGACKVVGRLKDMIKRGGENIAPADVEKVLELHPEIMAAAVVGIPNARWGEVVGAFIQRATVTAQTGTGSATRLRVGSKDIRTWLRNHISSHKVPSHFFWLGEDDGVPSELPLNASGKVLKNELSALAARLIS